MGLWASTVVVCIDSWMSTFEEKTLSRVKYEMPPIPMSQKTSAEEMEGFVVVKKSDLERIMALLLRLERKDVL